MISIFTLHLLYMRMHHPDQSADSDTTIRLKETTHRQLKRTKPDAITFDHFIKSLLSEIETIDYSISIEQNDS